MAKFPTSNPGAPKRKPDTKAILKGFTNNRKAIDAGKLTWEYLPKKIKHIKRDTSILISSQGKPLSNARGRKGLVYKTDEIKFFGRNMTKINGKNYVFVKVKHHLGEYRTKLKGKYRTYTGYIAVSSLTSVAPVKKAAVKKPAPVKAAAPKRTNVGPKIKTIKYKRPANTPTPKIKAKSKKVETKVKLKKTPKRIIEKKETSIQLADKAEKTLSPLLNDGIKISRDKLSITLTDTTLKSPHNLPAKIAILRTGLIKINGKATTLKTLLAKAKAAIKALRENVQKTKTTEKLSTSAENYAKNITLLQRYFKKAPFKKMGAKLATNEALEFGDKLVPDTILTLGKTHKYHFQIEFKNNKYYLSIGGMKTKKPHFTIATPIKYPKGSNSMGRFAKLATYYINTAKRGGFLKVLEAKRQAVIDKQNKAKQTKPAGTPAAKPTKKAPKQKETITTKGETAPPATLIKLQVEQAIKQYAEGYLEVEIKEAGDTKHLTIYEKLNPKKITAQMLVESGADKIAKYYVNGSDKAQSNFAKAMQMVVDEVKQNYRFDLKIEPETNTAKRPAAIEKQNKVKPAGAPATKAAPQKEKIPSAGSIKNKLELKIQKFTGGNVEVNVNEFKGETMVSLVGAHNKLIVGFSIDPSKAKPYEFQNKSYKTFGEAMRRAVKEVRKTYMMDLNPITGEVTYHADLTPLDENES
ncbi:hypothetical protein JKY72_06600 [Candidatus Gracilibacteria bacterium]|nr:hypothetical protein [Candidatus Gracilibacteria bacterium]